MAAANDASKELLKLEQQQKHTFIESNFLVCNKEVEAAATTVPHKQRKKNQANGNVDGKQPITTAVHTSQVLGKVKDFLGVMAEANKKLERSVQGKCSSNYDIEALSGNETEYIEMDLLLGVADLQTPEALAAAEAAIGGFRPSLPLFDGSSSPVAEDSSDEEKDDGNAVVRACPRKKFQKSDLDESLSTDPPKKRPKIVVLN